LDAESIAEKARKSIGKFCFEECGSYCCRKGYLVLNNDELELILKKKKREELIKILEDGRVSLYLGKNCPALGNNLRCKIHTNPLRPSACKQFLIFIRDNKIMLSGRCLAVKQGKLYPFISQWIALGYKIYESSDLEGHDLTGGETSTEKTS